MTEETHTELLAESVRRMLAGDARWSDVVEQGLTGFFSGEHSESLEDLLVVMIEMGRRASALPVLEAAIANRYGRGLAAANSRLALAIGTLSGKEHADNLVFDSQRVLGPARFVEGAADADAWLVLTDDCHLCAVARGAEGATLQSTPALAPGFADLHLWSPARSRRLTPDQCAELVAIARLGWAARAYGAALEGFEAFLHYGKERKQFGQPIASFQAIQHKAANSHMTLEGCRLQLAAAGRAHDEGAANWRALAVSATAFAAGGLRKVALETQHCFGAIGFAEEHQAPALFRRVHADVVRLGGVTKARAELADFVLAGGRAGVDALFGRADDPVAPFRSRFRKWLARYWSSNERDELRARAEGDRTWDLSFAERLGSAGWTTLNWPKAAGGLEATPLEQLAYAEELHRAGATDHALICSCRVMAPEIIAHGSQTLKDALLPGLRAGKITGCLGYSEPEAGSDLASLRTRAVRDGDAYFVNGQKIWTTDGHRASHMLLAARTHPDPKLRHAGISLFIVPMSTPGITVHPMEAMYGQKFCSVFFDNVRVSVDWRLGEENTGWAILAGALANERIAMGGLAIRVQALLGGIVQSVQSRPQLVQQSLTRDRIGQLTAELVTSRLLVAQSLEPASPGTPQLAQAAMAKVFASELAQTICESALDLLGASALLSHGADNVPADGDIELLLRSTIMFVVGGGSNEIQRNIIAQRGLGLGR
ncbi:acyl-CoA dehydrogenase family protein [Steroidobacter sp.]|uniref:acyl-CoA dehydrogenase family protein n=1 Tax=Steroidobacter sp. TaxID=1978227 RepID=UPI001A544EAB|nr:acyl-CoA dehydrogenase family protein [Steroidobacter sp.]MBL8265184.1 acyl-CoA dehydrogenase family protein [Steroidobacter sp.]